MRLYIIRHGETQWNHVHRLQGWSNTELNENGRELARKTAEGMRGIPFDAAFTSPLQRARETAALVLNGRDIPLTVDERLREICFGENEGMPWKAQEGERGNIPAIYNFFRRPQRYVPAPGGETLEQLAARTADFMRDICGRKELEEKTILISTHGAAMRALLNSLRTYDMSDFWGSGVAQNCGVAIVDCASGKPHLTAENLSFAAQTERDGERPIHENI